MLYVVFSRAHTQAMLIFLAGMNRKTRKAALDSFKEDPNIKVFLISLKVGHNALLLQSLNVF